MDIHPFNIATINKAVEFLHSGKLVAFPTETVYGLGADATNDLAVAEIFAVKGRPSFNPLIVHVRDASMAKEFVVWNELADKLMQKFSPGPLSIVLPRKQNSRISLLASAGGDTVAIRIPSGKVAQELLKASGLPIAAPSANRSGRISPTTAQHVYEELHDGLPLIIDGGNCEVGLESTVVDLSGNDIVILRPGAITREMLEQALNRKAYSVHDTKGLLKSPGLLASHYAPMLPLRLNAASASPDEALLAFGRNILSNAKYMLNLSEEGNLKEAAANLFAGLRKLDKPGVYSAIAVMPIPDTGIGVAINDRLKRAATLPA